MAQRLRTEIAVSALLRRAQSAGAFGAVLRKGDPDAGIYLVVVRRGAALSLYVPARNMDGARVWWPETDLSQSEIDAKVNRRIDSDPDIWVIEIEDAQGRTFLDEPIETPVAQDPALAAAKALFRDR